MEAIALWREGRELWYQYVRVNGYAFEPTREGLRHLARALDLRTSWIARRINAYLES